MFDQGLRSIIYVDVGMWVNSSKILYAYMHPVAIRDHAMHPVAIRDHAMHPVTIRDHAMHPVAIRDHAMHPVAIGLAAYPVTNYYYKRSYVHLM